MCVCVWGVEREIYGIHLVYFYNLAEDYYLIINDYFLHDWYQLWPSGGAGLLCWLKGAV